MARRQWSAARPTQKYIPAFTVVKLEGRTTRTMARMEPFGKPDKNGNPKHKLVYEQVPLELGFEVKFPRGHSIHVATAEELYELGYGDPEVPLIEPDGGEVVGSVPNNIRKARREEGSVNA
jgi:hypothetical protein